MADENYKLIFAGLDKAGKTTIHRKVMEEMGIEDIDDLRPTRGIERHTHDFLDTDFSVWDLGGQLSYRQTYLSKPEVFNMTRAMIFVVDIQDMDRLEEAYEYYVDILNILVNVEKKPKLYVLFHKFDPELRGKLRTHFYKATRLFRKADTIINEKFKGYATSIYSNNIDLAVKRILFDNFEDYKEKPTGSVKATADENKRLDTSVPSTPGLKAPSASKTPAPPAKSEAPPAKTMPSVAPVPSSREVTSEVKAEPVELKEPKELVEKPDLEKVELDKATPAFFDDVSDEVVERLTSVINKRMKDTPEIVALSILSSEGEQVLGIGKTDVDYERLEKLRGVVGELNPKRFFKDLSDIEYRGLGHFSLDDFDIYFASASENYAIAILTTDVSTLMLQNAQRIVKSIRQGLSLTGDDDSTGSDAPATKKKDLVGDLKSRLRNLSGLSDIG